MPGRSSSVARRIWSVIPGLYDGLRAGGRILAIGAAPCDKCRHSRRLGGRMKRAAILSMILWGLGAAGTGLPGGETTSAAPAAGDQAAGTDHPAQPSPARTRPPRSQPNRTQPAE